MSKRDLDGNDCSGTSIACKRWKNESEAVMAFLRHGVSLKQTAAILGLNVDVAAGLTSPFAKEVAMRTPKDEMICSITHELLENPVVASDGFTYERSALEQHFRTKATSPKTNAALGNRTMHSNHMAKILVDDWLEEQAALLPIALKQLLDGNEIEAAEKLVRDSSAWVTRFHAKPRLAFLELSMAIPLHGNNFKTRQDEYVAALTKEGLTEENALLKAHSLSAGYFNYSDLADRARVTSVLMPATRSSETFLFSFSLAPAAHYEIQKCIDSATFAVSGFGKCFMQLERQENAWSAYMFVKDHLPIVETRPLLLMLRPRGENAATNLIVWRETFIVFRPDASVQATWREKQRENYGYGGPIAPLNTAPLSLTLELVVRDLSGPEVSVPIEAGSNSTDSPTNNSTDSPTNQ